MVNISSKHIGIGLIVLASILFLVFLSSTKALNEAQDIQCRESCGLNMSPSCPHANGQIKNIPIESSVGFSLVITLLLAGIFMLFNAGKYKEELTEKEKNVEKLIKTLKGDEKQVCEIIQASGGTIFQSELIEKTGFSKVKVSRILDKLEARGLIERKRSGMTNVVVFK